MNKMRIPGASVLLVAVLFLSMGFSENGVTAEEPSVLLEFEADPSDETFEKALTGVSQSDQDAYLDYISKLRSIVRSSSALSADKQHELLGKCYEREGNILEQSESFHEAGEVFRDAAEEYRKAGLSDQADKMEDAGDRCYDYTTQSGTENDEGSEAISETASEPESSSETDPASEDEVTEATEQGRSTDRSSETKPAMQNTSLNPVIPGLGFPNIMIFELRNGEIFYGNTSDASDPMNPVANYLE